MTYPIYTKNEEASLLLHRECCSMIRKKQCYQNIWNIVTSAHFSKDFLIAYGYVQACPGVFVLHCFLIDKDGMVIDPTLPEGKNEHYYVIRCFSYKEYLEQVCESRYPSLENMKWMRQAISDFTLWGTKNGIVAIS